MKETKEFIKIVHEMTPLEKRDFVIYIIHCLLSVIMSRGWDIKVVGEKPLFTNPFIYFETDYLSFIFMDYVTGFKLKVDEFDYFNIFEVEGILDAFNDYFIGQRYTINDPNSFLSISDLYIIPHNDTEGFKGIYLVFNTCSELEV